MSGIQAFNIYPGPDYEGSFPGGKLPVGCRVSVQLPLEHVDMADYYTVQLDNLLFSQGIFVDPLSTNMSSSVKMTLNIDSLGVAAMLQDFFLKESLFDIQCDHLDLFLDGTVGGQYSVRLVSYEYVGRESVNNWTYALTIEKVNP